MIVHVEQNKIIQKIKKTGGKMQKKMHIVIGQKDKLIRERIEDYVKKHVPDQMARLTFTSSPDKILEIVRKHKKVLVISGYLFSNGVYGTGLALKFKELNPDAIFYIYSVERQSAINSNEAVDGVIPKFFKREVEELAEIICGNHDAAGFKREMAVLIERWK